MRSIGLTTKAFRTIATNRKTPTSIRMVQSGIILISDTQSI